uniref:Cytochrome b n=1 Tax=Eleutherocaulis alte TaxID=74076 RepID=A0A1P7YW99_9EUPU|nr:cytochrome b [Eleutherocaulis alte]AKM99599.1 cytochrome b [Eleutherocaulis alte]WDD39314.1 cytochrome b [Eleutherocaulis alte]
MHKFREVILLPSPISFNIWWNWGSILGLLLSVQIITGLILSMHYTADLVCTFDSVVHIVRDTSYGWFVRSIHANGASFFFFGIYFHIGRAIFYRSFKTQTKTWLIGVTIYIASMATAFLGYVLPWGQMSFWGATVITNLISAVPYLGVSMVEWIWGGFSVGQATLNRFFSLHFILPFVIMVLSMIHLVFLHESGSSSPLAEKSQINKITFHPYYSVKDLVGFVVLFWVMCVICCAFPNLFLDPENFMEANSMVTPVHIQPEWYFLFAYAILRSIPSKLGGVIALAVSIAVLYFIPVVNGNFNYKFKQLFYWGFVSLFLLLTWLGSCPIEEPYLTLSRPLTLMYFIFLFLL